MWYQIAVGVEESVVEILSDIFIEWGAISVSFEDAGEQPLFEPAPGETPLWHHTRVIGLFESPVEESKLKERVTSQLHCRWSEWNSTLLEDQVWECAWLEHFQPMCFGNRLWVCPTSLEPPESADVCVRLDPGLAFGTGTHPTTALCLEWLESQALSGKVVMDYGCGSGLLAIAALALGAVSALGVDIDPQALTASLENAKKNHLSSTQFVLAYPEDSILTGQQVDILIANILSGPLIQLSSRIISFLKPGGKCALSGILENQVEEVEQAYKSEVIFLPPVYREGWVLLTGTRRGGTIGITT